MKEQNRERFLRVYPTRLAIALKSIRLMGNCFNRTNYCYSEDEAYEIIEKLTNAIDDIEKRAKVKHSTTTNSPTLTLLLNNQT